MYSIILCLKLEVYKVVQSESIEPSDFERNPQGVSSILYGRFKVLRV